ncbi:hypothetical protein GCM10010991_33200 [Gemmobacter aquaticus]|uniref:Uncharacterized protein n=1 Tax=Gemmobacter aquaticus TaxID=490185 RepID=A0A917YPY8_9RHOB|nr:hypothetical protein GCM10010991_33200 [Gemmobacter aquaticus]
MPGNITLAETNWAQGVEPKPASESSIPDFMSNAPVAPCGPLAHDRPCACARRHARTPASPMR